jgi:DNA-binding LacI/PurR family transcriptional regulator
MPRKVTIHDISSESGTSPSTVSRVLTGSAVVSEAKRQAVEAAIRKLNYRPSHIARSLKTRTTQSIGLLLNDITNPFYSAVARGAEDEANRHNFSLILCNTNEEAARELQYLQLLEDKQVDGIILGPSGKNISTIQELAGRHPIVQIDRYIESVVASVVKVDNEAGAYAATRLLIDKGHRRIAAFRWGKRISTMSERYQGYERALTDAGLPIDPALVVDVPALDMNGTMELVRAVLTRPQRPTAVFALNNQIGSAAIGAIHRLRLRIPEDVALIVFDDLDYFTLIQPTISAVSQPAFEIGVQAVRLLLRQARSAEGLTAPEQLILPTDLVIRESV